MSKIVGENRMSEIAKIFGKKLGEEFLVRSYMPVGNCIGYFTKYGFEGRNLTIQESKDVFLLLCAGKAVIVDET